MVKVDWWNFLSTNPPRQARSWSWLGAIRQQAITWENTDPVLRWNMSSLWVKLVITTRFAPSQWEPMLQSNGVSHWLGANLESALQLTEVHGHCDKHNESEPHVEGRQEVDDSDDDIDDRRGDLEQNVTGNKKNTICNCNVGQLQFRIYIKTLAGIILCRCPANERWRYNVTSSPIGWAHTQKDPCTGDKLIGRVCSPMGVVRNWTHWGRDEIDAILQTPFSNEFSWMKMFWFRLKFHWSLFPMIQLRRQTTMLVSCSQCFWKDCICFIPVYFHFFFSPQV